MGPDETTTAPLRTGGTDQSQRGLPALQERPFAVDDLTLDQLAAMCARLGRQLRFVDLNDHDAGDWSALFERDEAFVLAVIAAWDCWGWQQEFVERCDAEAPAELAQRAMTLASTLDGWHAALGGSPLPEAVEVRDTLQQLVERQLASQVDWLRQTYGEAKVARPVKARPPAVGPAPEVPPAFGPTIAHQHAHLHPMWRAQDSLQVQPPQGTPRQRLRGIGLSLNSAVQQLQGLARERLEKTLDTGEHEPAAGLLLAFLRLYAAVQAQVNRFSERHVDFYYREVLQLRERAALPDRVQVVCERDARQTGVVEVPRGTLFPAGKNSADQPMFFRADDALQVGDARVVEITTLLLQREKNILPEFDLGYVSGIRARRMPAPGPDADPVPLFGGGSGSVEGDLGLAVASPLLFLAEGTRQIDFELSLVWPGCTPRSLADAALAIQDDVDAFRRALGALTACWMLGDGTGLTNDQRERLRRHKLLTVKQRRALAADELPPETRHTHDLDHEFDPTKGNELLCQLCRPVPRGEPDKSRDLAFFDNAVDLFDVGLTFAEGWGMADRLQVARPRKGGGLRMTIFLRPDDPAVVGCDPRLHGVKWPTRLPLLRLLVGKRARVHPWSLLHAAEVQFAELSVQVHGVRRLLLANQIGPLDGTKSFAPFGPLPTTSSYLLVGSPEAAQKDLQTLALNVLWAGLPSEPGGWATHYAMYAPEQSEGRFAAALSLLRGDRWQACSGISSRQPLFAPLDAQDMLQPAQCIVVDPTSVREHARAGSNPLEEVAGATDGLLRLQIAEPRGAFGHVAYPSLLSDALRVRTRRGTTAPLPNAPYTPEFERITLDYSARSHLRATRESLPDGAPTADDPERMLHVRPFGVSDMAATASRPRPGPLPELGAEGSMCMGLRATALGGPLSLQFQLLPGRAAELDPGSRREPIRWHVLMQDRWEELPPRHVLSDTTYGFLTSGIVTLDLPEGMTPDATVFGGGLFWLRASADSSLDVAAPLISVQAQALTLTRAPLVVPASVKTAPAAAQTLPAGRIGLPETAIPGLAGVAQYEPSGGLRAAEDTRQLLIRAGERLRHKNRATLAWDYERIVLELFPEVFKVRCFMPPEADCRPGQVRVVVVPHVPPDDPAQRTLAARLNTLTLQKIRSELSRRASPLVDVQVRNASYERVKVRCRVQLEPRVQTGAVLQQINQVLTDHLSPWSRDGLGPRFEWVLRCDEVEAQVRRVPGVAMVFALSLLHVVRDDRGVYELGDSARTLARQAPHEPTLKHRYPWSLALPIAEHLIELASDLNDRKVYTTGLPLLRIGETFVVGRGKVA